MNLLIDFLKNILSLLGTTTQLIGSILKYIIQKSWKFIILLLGLFITLFSINKASKED